MALQDKYTKLLDAHNTLLKESETRRNVNHALVAENERLREHLGGFIGKQVNPPVILTADAQARIADMEIEHGQKLNWYIRALIGSVVVNALLVLFLVAKALA